MIEQVLLPDRPEEAVTSLGDGSAVLAGGTILMPVVNNRATQINRLVSTKRLPRDAVSVSTGRATVPASMTLTALAAHDELRFLRDAIATIASPTVRNMATIGGNLFADQPYGDLAVCLLALDATVEVLGSGGSRSMSVEEVLRGEMSNHELVTSVTFDVPEAGEWFYTKAMRRKLNSASIVTVAARLRFDGDIVESARVALGGAGPKARRSPGAEDVLVGRALDDDSGIAAGNAAVADADFFTDEYASAWYRERVMPVHVRRALLGLPNEAGS